MAISEYEGILTPASTTWLITTANWRDYTQLKNLTKACFMSSDVWPFWDLFGILSLPGMIRFKAVMEGRMVGFIGGERKLDQEAGWITTLAVSPAYRRRGIASALLAQGEEALAMPRIKLSVRASNHSAINLYKVTGYKLVDRWNKYYAGGEDALVFEKRC